MHQTHSHPEIYNPDIPNDIKCKILEQLCNALAVHRGVSIGNLRNDLEKKLHVDVNNLENNPVGMLLLYEYLYSLRPEACHQIEKSQTH
ncbi:hypothetical protein [Klebsiella aerogenes]|uniref:hypothetical protein n=1 Tax=Klebsiella aerogenes TaxID=548 RepID=UPI000949834F|nr:hypothetical protein [Klebsiella aerogenes]